MHKGVDLLNKLRISDGIPSKVDYNKIQGNGGWSKESGSESEWFAPEEQKILELLELTINENDYKFFPAVQNKNYLAENGELDDVSGDYINRDF